MSLYRQLLGELVQEALPYRRYKPVRPQSAGFVRYRPNYKVIDGESLGIPLGHVISMETVG